MQPNEGQNLWQPEGREGEATPPSQFDGFEMTAPDVFPEGQVVEGGQLIEWEASEYIHHEKDGSWFTLLGIATAIIIGLALIFQWWTFALLVLVMSVAIVFFARRPPRTLHYALDNTGVRINDRLFPYGDFRAFGVLNEGPLFSIILLPNKRFQPATSMYIEQQDGEKIVDILGSYLPLEPVKSDPIDNLTRKLRF